MKANNTVSAAANLKGMAKHTYNRVMSAMTEDDTQYMGHTFAALTDGAKAIAMQSGHYIAAYYRGERKGMAAEEAAKELTERAAVYVTRKLRNIDMICAAAFLAEYISRQRKAEEPTTPEPNNTPATMNAKSAKDLERQIARISGARFGKALEIYSRYLHNIAVYFSGDKYPHAPAMTPDQLKIKVPQSIYAAK